jgi:hypothetical protein
MSQDGQRPGSRTSPAGSPATGVTKIIEDALRKAGLMK